MADISRKFADKPYHDKIVAGIMEWRTPREKREELRCVRKMVAM